VEEEEDLGNLLIKIHCGKLLLKQRRRKNLNAVVSITRSVVFFWILVYFQMQIVSTVKKVFAVKFFMA